MTLFEGLYGYEAVLMVLGILLFVVTLVCLVYYVVKQRNLKTLSIFFVISVVMIGYPSIQKVRIGQDLVEIEKATEDLAEDPGKQSTKRELVGTLKSIEGRRITEPAKLVTVARAQAAVGDTTKALTYVNKALRINPDDPVARDLRRQLRR